MCSLWPPPEHRLEFLAPHREKVSEFVSPLELGGVLLHKLTQPFYCSVSTLEFNWALLAVTGSKVYGGEAFHFVAVVWHIVGRGIHLGDHQVLLRFVFFAKCQVVRLQLFTVAAPRSIKLNQDILLSIHDDFIKRLPHHNLYWSLVVLWHWLGFNDGLELSC